MDPLSISASIAGLITITDVIAGKSYKYIKEARGASKEAKKLLGEITDLFGILNSLRLVAARYEDEAFKSTMQTQHIHSCHMLLEKIKDRLDRADPSQVNNEQTSLRRKTSSWGRSLAWPFTVSETKSLIDEVVNHKSTMTLALAADGMRVILDSLGTYDHIRNQENSIKLRQPGTGVWFTEGFHFTKWLATKNARLWLYGIRIGYFYCDYRDPKTHDPKIILGSLARQLAIQDPQCMTELEAFYKINCPDTGVPPSFTSEALCLLLKSFSPFFEEIVIIIDALDECGTDRSHVVEILASLHNNGASNIKTLFTSRWETDIEVHLVDYEKVSIAATSSDLKLYVAAEIEKRSLKKILRMRDPELKIEIMERLVEGAEGIQDDNTLDREAMPDEQGILRWCSSLIRRTPDSERLELAHFTVEEFLRNINVRDLNSKYAKYGLSDSDHELVFHCIQFVNGL
ncbi:hypothetical protein B0O99DRAFT_654160 [Bisporella sp. PMI_857]|nr:hypothetical protein B0O99DRAFT_654160 [Bisporella sp. PMI_857]